MNWFSLRIGSILIPTLGLASSLLAQAPLPAENLARDLQRLAPLSPADAQAAFAIQHGFTMDLVAAEPLVSDPVDACFDARGRLFVAEMHGYPFSEEVREQQPEPIGKKDACLVRLLEDVNGDGVFDKSSIYASGFSWATSVCCYDDGVFVLAPSTLYYFKDTSGDGVADIKDVVATGFSRANVQGLANNLKWGLDGWIYGSAGTNGGDLVVGGKPVGSMRGRDFAFHPRTREFRFITGGQQFGHSMDNWGNRFVCSNSNHIQEVIYPLDALERANGVSIGRPIRSIGKEGAAAPVFRKSPAEPWRIVRTRRRASDPDYRKRLPESELVITGFFTSATGVTIYRGDAYPPEFQGNAFVGDVGGNLIHRKQLLDDGVGYLAVRADQNVEFVTSTDTWFRPVNFLNAPDGCLYVLDMYRETIEHPVSIPADIKSFLNLESGDDRGRVYRLTPPGWSTRTVQKMNDWPSSELVQVLASPNGWHRDTASRLLVERQDRTVEADLRKLFETSESPLGRLHALYALHNLGVIHEADVESGLRDHDPHVVVHALRLAKAFIGNPDSTLSKQLSALVEHPDVRVQFELALLLGDVRDQDRSPLWTRLAARQKLDADVSTALMMALPSQVLPLMQQMASAAKDASQVSPLLRDLTRRLGRNRNDAEAASLLKFLLSNQVTPSCQVALIHDFAVGLRQRQIALPAFSTQHLSQTSSEGRRLAELWEHAKEVAANPSDQPDAVQQIQLLGDAPWDFAREPLDGLISPIVDPNLQIAAVQSLSRHPGIEPLGLLIEKWSSLSPQVKREAVELGLVDEPRALALLAAVGDGKVIGSDIAIDQWARLQQHPRAGVRELAEKLNSSRGTQDRKLVIEQFTKEMPATANLSSGKELFTKHCAICHRAGSEGKAVGPDINSVRNKSIDDLLVAILDPSREAQPNFTSYTAALLDGRIVTGIISTETAQSVTLKQAEGKEETFPRSDIDAIKSNGVSLMPIGLEKNVTPAQLADIIRFIKEGEY